MAKFREGDVFAIPLPDGDWLPGRILLDLNRVFAQKLVKEASPFRVRWRSILVEVYSQPTTEPSDSGSNVLIPGAWIEADAITGREKPRWPIVGHRTVTPEDVDFPENVVAVESKTTFEKGEIRKQVPAPLSDVERWECRTISQLPAQFIYTCNYYLDRKQHLGSDPEIFSLQNVDLRFSPFREQVYGLMNEDPKRGYFEWATSLGLNPARLWE